MFHETDCGDARSRPPVESYDRCWRWVIAGLGDSDPSIGARFPALFAAAGLPQPTMRLEALIGGPESLAPVDLVVGLVATLRPEIERQGLAGDVTGGAATDSATLAARIREEAAQADSVLIGRSEIGAWCRV